jgi:hypothetical protein
MFLDIDGEASDYQYLDTVSTYIKVHTVCTVRSNPVVS